MPIRYRVVRDAAIRGATGERFIVTSWFGNGIGRQVNRAVFAVPGTAIG